MEADVRCEFFDLGDPFSETGRLPRSTALTPQKAVQEAEERKQNAAERAARRYAELEAQQQKKKIVVMDTFVAPKKGQFKHSLKGARKGSAAASSYSAPSKAQTSLQKARAESQRARVALTHASGKYVPPPPSKRPVASSSQSAYTNPYAPGPSRTSYSPAASSVNPVPADKMVTGPRLPPPRVPRPKPAPEAERIQGAYITDPSARKALPSHIKPSKPEQVERFRIDDSAPKAREIHRPKVDNFVPDKPKRPIIDFFGGAASKKRPAEALGRDDKRARNGTSPSTQASSAPGSGASTPSRPPPPRKPARPMEDVLFAAKKKRPLPAKR